MVFHIDPRIHISKLVCTFFGLFSHFFDSSAFSVPQDESSSDRGGHHSDDECWDTPPPKPPRIRRWGANLKIFLCWVFPAISKQPLSLWKLWKFPHCGTHEGSAYLNKVCTVWSIVEWTADSCCRWDGTNRDQDNINTRRDWGGD